MNKITASGLICSEIEFLYQHYGENFYSFFLCTRRKSGAVDYIPCVVPEILVKRIREGDSVQLLGEIRTKNYSDENGKRHLEIIAFIQGICDYPGYDMNNFSIDGFVCSKKDKRDTASGRVIVDFIVASQRSIHKSDYIPCIAWGRNALRVSELEIGTKIRANGRFQSREYKKYVDGNEEDMVAYEISITSFAEGGLNGRTDNPDANGAL